MMKGFLATLFAAAITFAASPAVFASAPTIGNIPDVIVGDADPADNPGGTDNNFFVFSNAFKFSTYVTPGLGSQFSDLVWTFGEFDYLSGANPATPHYTINGVTRANDNSTSIAQDQGNNNARAKNATYKINGPTAGVGNDFASFRDIVFSPTTGTTPFPSPSPAAATQAGAGKLVKFYVSDNNGYLVSKDIVVSSVDGSIDKLTPVSGWTQTVDDHIVSPQTGWAFLNLAAGSEASSGQTATDLRVNVTAASGHSRVAGWNNVNLMNYQTVVGSANFVRGKFYIYSTAGSSAPINNVPNFRIRLQAGIPADGPNDQYQVNDLLFASTGQTGTNAIADDLSNEQISGIDIQPSRVAATPSLYRVDLDPVDVPSLTASGKIGVDWQTMATSNNTNTAIALCEVVLGTYPASALADASGTELLKYYANSANGTSNVTAGFGAFNLENNASSGYLQNFNVTGTATSSSSTAGFQFDTTAVATDKLGVGLLTFATSGNAANARIGLNKIYKARYHATSALPTTSSNAATAVAGYIRFRLQTASQSYGSRLEISGPANPSNGTNTVMKEAIPGVGCANPDKNATYVTAGRGGGWYTSLMSSPLNPDIHPERGGTGTNDALAVSRMSTLAAQPAAGSASASQRDIASGVDVVKVPQWVTFNSLTISPFAAKNEANYRVEEFHLYEFPQIDDGGYNPQAAAFP